MLKKIGTVCTLLTLATVLIAVGCGKGKKNENKGATMAPNRNTFRRATRVRSPERLATTARQAS